jgi:hypothetical protein
VLPSLLPFVASGQVVLFQIALVSVAVLILTAPARFVLVKFAPHWKLKSALVKVASSGVTGESSLQNRVTEVRARHVRACEIRRYVARVFGDVEELSLHGNRYQVGSLDSRLGR